MNWHLYPTLCAASAVIACATLSGAAPSPSTVNPADPGLTRAAVSQGSAQSPAAEPKSTPAVAPNTTPAVAPDSTPAIAPDSTPAIAPNTTPAVKPAVKAAPPAAARRAVVADTYVVAPGEPVTLRWYFTGTKVTVTGGRFVQPSVVTGHTSLTDHPRKSTKYVFNVWYRGASTGGGPITDLHAAYFVSITVDPNIPALASYSDPHGWQVSFLSGWRRDNVNTPDEGSDGLVFFQKEEDSVERLTVAVMPVKDMDTEGLVKMVCKDIPARYAEANVITSDGITHEGIAAHRVEFMGVDQSHPGTHTRSIVLALVRNGRGYVLSARTTAARYPQRKALLERMLRSFTFTRAKYSMVAR